MHSKTFIACCFIAGLHCTNHSPAIQVDRQVNESQHKIIIGTDTNPYHQVKEIPLPAGFTRVPYTPFSFGKWLSSVKLKKDKTVYIFNGTAKHNQSAQFAVLDISVGTKDLQQCADAVMRLRAEYLFDAQQFDGIRFRDNNGTAYQFSTPFTRQHLQEYLQQVFGMCGTASLSKQLSPTGWNNVVAGDVLIKGGFPGHAVIVMDVATNKAGRKIFLLAQSYMPAQDIHLLVNPSNHDLSPWYEVNDDEIIETPEYRFTRNQLKSW